MIRWKRRLALAPAWGDLAAKPIMVLVPGGKRAYLWVGDDERKQFYGTVDGAKLRRFAQAILDELAKQ